MFYSMCAYSHFLWVSGLCGQSVLQMLPVVCGGFLGPLNRDCIFFSLLLKSYVELSRMGHVDQGG